MKKTDNQQVEIIIEGKSRYGALFQGKRAWNPTFMPIFVRKNKIHMKRFAAFLGLILIVGTATADTVDSLYRKVLEGRHADHRSATQLFVALDAEGVTDSLLVVGKHEGSDEVRQKACYNMGLFYNSTYRHRQAAEAFMQAAHYAYNIKDERARAEALSAAAVQHHLLGDFEQAIARCTEALSIDSALHDAEALSCDLNILSGSSLSAGHTDDALRYIQKAIEWEKSRKHPSKLSIRYGSAAEILNKSGDTDKALHYATMAYELDKKDGNAIGVARRMSQMADIYAHRKEYEAAERYYRRAIDTLEAHGELHSLGIDYRLLGNVLQLEGRHAQALTSYAQAEQLARQMGNRYYLSLVARSMAESHRAMGHDAQAADYLSLALALGDSLHNEKLEQMAADYRMQFELQEASREAQRKTDVLRMQQVTIGLLALLLLVVGAVWWQARREKKARQTANPAPAVLPDSHHEPQALETMEEKTAETTEKSAHSADDRRFLASVSDFVHANMKSRKITIDLLAEQLCMSRNQFARRLTAISGDTPNTYITRIKMEKAVRLLRDTTMPVKEVAYECGFDEPNYFIQVFRKMYDVTPQQYRNTPHKA